MAFTRRTTEPVPELETPIWSCSSEQCTGWMRTEFTFEEKPNCPLCHTPMVLEKKVLPVIDS